MATVNVLYEGYVKEVENGELVRTTTTLILDDDIKMVVDPGLVEAPELIVNSLGKFNLKPDDITHVYVTHWHIDHVRYIGLFKNAIIYDYLYSYNGELWSDHEGDGFKISKNIQIVHTPGHTLDDSSLLIKSQNLGIVAISHVYWFNDRTPIEDPMAVDQEKLNQSRKIIESKADWIITPHGGKIKVK